MAERSETQEQSIKARKSQLFEVEETKRLGPKQIRKPFAVLLRETPAAPLSGGAKALLWSLAVVVLGLLALALTSARPSKPKPAKASVKSAVRSTEVSQNKSFVA